MPTVGSPSRPLAADLRNGHLGTPAYWAPEQAAGTPEAHDERTDVYGLGAILFAILTGNSPHPDGTHPPQTVAPHERYPHVDAGIGEITQRAMAIEPAARYESAAALAEAVELWLADQPLLAQRGAVAALERAVEESPTTHALVEQLGRQRSNLGLMLAGMGRDADAATELRAAADVFAHLVAARNKPRFLADQANCLLALARVLGAQGDTDGEKAAQREAAALYQKLIAARPNEYKANYATLILPPGLALEPAKAEPPPAFDETLPPAVPPEPGTASSLPEGTSGAVLDSAAGITVYPLPENTSGAGVDPGAELTAYPASDPERLIPHPVEEQLSAAGGYTILGELARGGMATLFLARDNELGRRVVIKTLHGLGGNELGRRLLREVRITASLEHPNIVRVYSYATRRDGTPFIVMEYLNGVTALNLLGVHGPGWTADLLDPLAQTCDALHFAHTHGVIHRDAKPSNVVVLSTGRAVLLDWGLAKVIGAPELASEEPEHADGRLITDPLLTHDGAVMGTPAYMAPEQARGDVAAMCPQTDVFAVGACLFNAVTGRPPGVGGAVAETLALRATGTVPRLRDARPDAPPELDAICARAMASQPEDRYPTAAALAADIRAFLAAQR